MKKFNLSSSWQKVLSKKINSKKYLSIINFIENEKKLGKKIYPEKESIFKGKYFHSFTGLPIQSSVEGLNFLIN